MAREQENGMHANTGKQKYPAFNIAVRKKMMTQVTYFNMGKNNIGLCDKIHPFNWKSYLGRVWLGRFKETELIFKTREKVLGLQHISTITSV